MDDDLRTISNRPGWKLWIAGHRRLTISAGVSTGLILFVIVGHFLPQPTDRSPPGCPGVVDSSDYATAEPQVIHRTVPDLDPSPTKPEFSSREADLFRQVSFSGTEYGYGPKISLRWDRTVNVYVLGNSELFEFAIDALKTVAELTNLEMEISDDPRRANMAVCLGFAWTEHVNNRIGWGPEGDPYAGQSWGYAVMEADSSGEIFAGLASVSAVRPHGEPISLSLTKAAITEEITHVVSTLDDFALREFSDIEDADTSIFVGGPVIESLNELDRRMISALYGPIPAGSTWEEALTYIEIVD